MKKVIFILTLLAGLCSESIHAQVNVVDSLEHELMKTKEDTSQIIILNKLFDIEYDSDYEKGFQYASLSLKKSKLLDLDKKENLKFLSVGYNNLGISYLLMADYDKSLKNLLSSLEIAETLNDTVKISNALNNIGSMYGYKGDMDKAFDYFSKSAELDELSGNLEAAGMSYSNLVAYYFSIPDYEKGKVYYDKAMSIFKELNIDSEIATLYVSNAMALRKMKKYKDALKYYQLAISIHKVNEDIGSLAIAYINVSSLYLDVNKRELAAEYGELALEKSLELNSPDGIMRGYEGLADIYEATGNMGKALENYKKSIEWKDTIYNQESTASMEEMIAKYNFAKKEKENEILKKNAAISDLEIENNQKELLTSKIIMFSAVAGGVLLLLLAFMLYNRIKLKQQANDGLQLANDKLKEAKEVIEEKNRDITSSIEYAQYIQQAVLPKKERVAEAFDDSFLMLLPKDLVSGDFYWFKQFGKYSILVLADCTGHGVPGGFMSMMGAELLNQVLSDPGVNDPGVALSLIDERIRKNLNQVGSKRRQNDGMDMVLTVFDNEENLLHFAGANRPLIKVRNGELDMIKGTRDGVGGGNSGNKNFESHTLDLKKGDCYYMYSDGYPDQFGGPKNKKFMRKKLNELILENSQNPMANQEATLLKAFNDWKEGVEQIDDVCLIGVRV